MRHLPFIIDLALVVYCVVDCITADSILVRTLQKPLWMMLIIVLPLIGSIAWLVAGRPRHDQRSRDVLWPSMATPAFPEYERSRPPCLPDDDPAAR